MEAKEQRANSGDQEDVDKVGRDIFEDTHS
jgi:hypothetical protein